jgi:hypothetical protein
MKMSYKSGMSDVEKAEHKNNFSKFAGRKQNERILTADNRRNQYPSEYCTIAARRAKATGEKQT